MRHLLNTDSIVSYLKLDKSERPITTLPMNYTYGLSIINSHLAVGAEILLTDRSLMQREFWAFLKDRQATSFGGEDLVKGDERHGRLETGDIARCDADGYYYITGRKKRFLKIYGNRVNLDDCERLLETSFEGRYEYACAGTDDRLVIFGTYEALCECRDV